MVHWGYGESAIKICCDVSMSELWTSSLNIGLGLLNNYITVYLTLLVRLHFYLRLNKTQPTYRDIKQFFHLLIKRIRKYNHSNQEMW